MSKRATSDHQKAKYKAHPAIAIANKRRRLAKHIKRQPNDQQAVAALAAGGGAA